MKYRALHELIKKVQEITIGNVRLGGFQKTKWYLHIGITYNTVLIRN